MRPRSPWRLVGRMFCHLLTIEPVDFDGLDRYLERRCGEDELAPLGFAASHHLAGGLHHSLSAPRKAPPAL